MRRVMVVLGTRPEAIKLAPVILELAKQEYELQPLVCVTGQHRQMLDPVMSWFGIQAHVDLNLMQPDQGAAEFAALALAGLSGVIREVNPDVVLVQGDTTTAAMASLAAFYGRVPVGHVEAGLRTYQIYNPFPEEMNRRVTGLVAAWHFAPAEKARRDLLAERVDPQAVFCVGNTVVDALRLTMERRHEVTAPLPPRDGRSRVLVTAHRRESFGAAFEEICMALRDVAERNADVELIYPVHLNPNVRDPVLRLLGNHDRIRLMEPLRYEQFVHLMSECDLILTDSGGIQEEATVLGKPTLVMRDTTERPEAVECGTALLVGTNRDAIVESTERLLRDRAAYNKMAGERPAFGDGYAARRIVEILKEKLSV